MEYVSTQKFVKISPKKIRPVVEMVKKMDPVAAVKVLPFIGKRASEPLLKVIKSALANARQADAVESSLVFKEIQIGEGPRLKRGRAGSRGRLKPYKRRMSHIRVVLATKEPKVKEAKVEKSEVKAEPEKKVTKPVKKVARIAKKGAK